MSNKLTFKEKLHRKYVEQSLKDAEDYRAMGRGYNRYFENWLEYQVTTPKGKKRIIRIYDGAWYTHRLTDAQRRGLKGLYLLLWLLSAVFFSLAGFQWTASNSSPYVYFVQCLALLGLVASGYAVICYMVAPAKMTIGQYKGSSVLLQRLCRASAIGHGLVALATLVHALVLLFAGGAASGAVTELLCALSFLAAAASIYALCRIEKDKVKYNTAAAKASPPPGAEKIKDRDLTL